MKYLKVLLFGIFAGLAIGLGSFVFTVVSAYAKNTGTMIFASALFSIGLILVCTLGLQLYTGKVGVIFDDKEKLKENAINLPIMLIPLVPESFQDAAMIPAQCVPCPL